MVLPERIELSTSPLPRECSTTELRQPAREVARVMPQGSGGVQAEKTPALHYPWAPACAASSVER